ncbi:hypothetical protein DRQ25_05145 [Candidatus Fermentibacteria bacterium]|nr:MAG: hypothetical protein DRQ25_05145 [Candidatus Fermentibacteria bacterium]
MFLVAFNNELAKYAIASPLARLIVRKELAAKAGVPTPLERQEEERRAKELAKTANGDMVEYFNQNPKKYEEWKERQRAKKALKAKKKRLKGTASERFVRSRSMAKKAGDGSKSIPHLPWMPPPLQSRDPKSLSITESDARHGIGARKPGMATKLLPRMVVEKRSKPGRYRGMSERVARVRNASKGKEPDYELSRHRTTQATAAGSRTGASMVAMPNMAKQKPLPSPAKRMELPSLSSARAMGKSAGVAKKQVTYEGVKLKLEHLKGDIRSGVNGATGEKWSRKMFDHYGYVPGTKGKGADGDALDIYLSADPVEAPIYKVRQKKKTGEYDEDKFMVGYDSATSALKAFKRNMPAWALGSMTRVSLDKFRDMVR